MSYTENLACLALSSDVKETEVELEQRVPNLGSSGDPGHSSSLATVFGHG